MSTKKTSLVLCSLVAVLLALASGTAWANDTTYYPTTKTIEKNKAFTETFDITVTAPTTIPSPQGNPFAGFPVITSVQITATDWPLASSQAEALGLVSADPTSLTFTSLGNQQILTITVETSNVTTVGTYAYTIFAKKPPGQGYAGWGEGTPVVLTVTVTEPTPTDTTPPSVTITSPTPDQAFTFCTGGTSINVAFNAQDGGSAISAVDADVNGSAVFLSTVTGIGTGNVDASGSYNANFLGGYTLTARATSLGGTGDATQNFSVNFTLMWLPPLSLGKTSKGGSTVPIKFTARDCNGEFVHDTSVKVVVYELTGSGDVEALSGFFGEGASSVRIDDEGGQYIINFQTAPGAHNYRVDVYFNDFNNAPFKQGSKTFSVR